MWSLLQELDVILETQIFCLKEISYAELFILVAIYILFVVSLFYKPSSKNVLGYLVK